MAPNPRRQDSSLAKLYDTLPRIDCQRLCHDSCGPISCSVRERNRMERVSGHALGTEGIKCNMLKDGLCSVYEVRPMICRLWGLVESMKCHYGCVPEGGWLPDEVGAQLLLDAIAAGGPVTHADATFVKLMEEKREEIGDELMERRIKDAFREHAQRPTLAGRGSLRTILDR